jgi:membrane protease YdiL (CAAX protease family)
MMPARRNGRRRARPADVAFAACCAVVLTWYNNVAGRRDWHRRWYPAVNLAAGVTGLAAARASGLTAADLGLATGRLRPGVRLGCAVAVPVAASLAAAAALPATRPLLADQRNTAVTGWQHAYQVLLRIPLGTVAWEEAAFRGVLHASVRRVLPAPAAIAVTSGLFGAWHIRPTADALRVNRLAATPRARTLAVTGGVLATGAAGALLSWLRERSGSLAAPVVVHLAANCGGLLASSFARGRAVPGPGRVLDAVSRPGSTVPPRPPARCRR